MHPHPDHDIPKLDSEEVLQIVFDVLIQRHPAVVAFTELTAEFPYAGTDQAIPDSVVRDAVDELVRLGLAHRLDCFILASYTAVRAEQLR